MHFPCMEYQHISVRRETRINHSHDDYLYQKWKNNPTAHQLKPTKNHTTKTVASVPFTHKYDPSVRPIHTQDPFCTQHTRLSPD